jgi:hypothetical protein
MHLIKKSKVISNKNKQNENLEINFYGIKLSCTKITVEVIVLVGLILTFLLLMVILL